ncbi:MAG: hypothetical protein NC180_00405 [Muribaculaceae bacterium]|nr:hypothetical protein [Roseburia sp.]MCM1431653.1 hypothetical protein [Muribaculaceae bacterium]MCM1491675.1 hypothetical protein [Muribaculaceae bacterium]
MDKYEYNLKLDQMKSLIADEKYQEAAEIADSVNWNKVKNPTALLRAGEIYEKVERYEDSRNVLLMAYDRSPIGRAIIYRLAEVAVRLRDFQAAQQYYDEFVEIAPHDNLKYVLSYDIRKAQGAPHRELIPILEELKEQEYTEEWAYELAYLYHKAGMSEKCIDACDELILWFGDGPYVERALELKMLYQPLTKVQEEKYRSFRQAKDGYTHIAIDELQQAGEFAKEAVAIPPVQVSAERYNTVNLQEEIARGMQQIMAATEKSAVTDTLETINKMVEDIPYLKLPKETQEEEISHIETDEEIDGSLKINFQEMLGEELDGQMSLMMDERSQVERQITGQITIEEVLEEWERTKRAAESALLDAEQRKLESAKARALQEAGNIMERLTDAMPKLDAGVTPRELLEEEYLQERPLPGAVTEKLFTVAADVLPTQEDELHADIEIISENELLENGRDSGDALDQLLDEAVQEEIQAAREPVPESEIMAEEYAGIAEEFAAGEPEAGIMAEEFAGIAEEFATGESMPEITAGEPVPESEIMAEEFAGISGEPATGEAEPEITAEEPATGEPEPEITAEEAVAILEKAVAEESVPKQTFKKQATEKFKTERWKGKTVRLPKIQEPEDLGRPDGGAEPETIEKLTDEQKKIFSYFIPVKGMEGQLCRALTGVTRHLTKDSKATTGNLIVQGGQGCGKTTLATSVIRVLQQETGRPNDKIGKIHAEALNRRDVGELLAKVEGGCLIIEQAGELEKRTVAALAKLLKQNDSGLLVIIEDTSKGIKKLLSQDDSFAEMFTEKITVPIFTNDELVSFAKSYSKELGYEIDELAVLALYKRISSIQKLDQATTLTEVKDIVDEAIQREAKGGVKKFFSILTASRYTDDDCIVLNEKDFE